MTQTLERITYVEDDPDIRALTEIALTSIGGYVLDVCESGDETLKRAPGFGPDLILLDVMMPGLDGTQTLQKLREIPATASVPIIFMTAKAQAHEVEAYKKLGAIDVIPKPFDLIKLPGRIMESWKLHTETQGPSA